MAHSKQHTGRSATWSSWTSNERHACSNPRRTGSCMAAEELCSCTTSIGGATTTLLALDSGLRGQGYRRGTSFNVSFHVLLVNSVINFGWFGKWNMHISGCWVLGLWSIIHRFVVRSVINLHFCSCGLAAPNGTNTAMPWDQLVPMSLWMWLTWQCQRIEKEKHSFLWMLNLMSSRNRSVTMRICWLFWGKWVWELFVAKSILFESCSSIFVRVW